MTPEVEIPKNDGFTQLNTNSNAFIPPGKQIKAVPDALTGASIPNVFKEGEIVPKILTKPGSKEL